MKQKKKKANPQQTKQESRRQLNEFCQKMKHMMGILGDASAFDLLDKPEMAYIHYQRLRPYKIINSTNKQDKTNKRNLRLLNQHLSESLHGAVIAVGKETNVSLYDFAVYAETLYMFWRNAHKTFPEKAEEFKAHFPVFMGEFQKIRLEVFEQINQYLEMLSWMYSDFINSVIRFVPEKTDNEKPVPDLSAFYNNYVLEQKKPETESLEIDGHRRTIYQVCVTAKQGFYPLSITPGKLGITGLMQEFPLKVYVQLHVLERLKERLGNHFRQLSYLYVMGAMLQKPVLAGHEQGLLFPVMSGTVKLGYLKAVIIGDKLVVLTFLFVTNNGTPEGKKLKDLIGLQKEDKKYLGIDKLSTFIKSDIKQDEKLKALFCQAGCGSLFQMAKEFLDQPDQKEIACAAYLSHYLGMEEGCPDTVEESHISISL